MRLSANTGFLFKDLPLPDRIRAAGQAGFDAVEFHDDAQDYDPAAFDAALAETGLPVLSLNTRMGNTVGCAAIPGEEAQAGHDFDAALAVAERVDAKAIHVLSGLTDAPGRLERLASNLARFADMTDRTLLIEPISARAMPGYALRSIDTAAEVIAVAGRPNIRILFDCFHILAEGAEIAPTFRRHAKLIGHVQIASFPERGPPGKTPDYPPLLQLFSASGITAVGCEFNPGSGHPDATQVRRAIGGSSAIGEKPA